MKNLMLLKLACCSIILGLSACTESKNAGKTNITEGDVLVVSYIGYTDYEVRVGNQNNLSITLKEDSKALDEVVVVGYGTQTKVNLTGAVSTISKDDLVNLKSATYRV